MDKQSLKKLVIFYSLDGNTKYIAKNIANSVKADMLELKVKNQKKQKGFLKYFLAVMQVVFKIKPKLLSLEKNPEEYDIIFIGTPVWAGNYNPAFNSFFSNIQLEGKRIALFSCYAESEGKSFLNLKEKLCNNEIIGEIGFRTPLKNNAADNKDKVIKWAKKIIPNQ
ncbi:MAG: flavodoxin [Spirochaetes bacterium]|nr:flavodoxin [Spirochaetota bacterium]